MHLLGFRFAPRMRDFANRRLYVLGPAASYRRLTALIADSIRADLIEESWDELLRLATSIKVGAIAPSVMRTRLAAYPRQGSLAEALRELGRIERTLFALDWLDHPALRRPSLVALTGRESHPSFKRTVFFNRLGERCDRTFGNQGYHASGLDLVIATIVLWNAVYPRTGRRRAPRPGGTVPADPLVHVAPLGWEHVGHTGDCSWTGTVPGPDHFRPLRGLRSSLFKLAA